MDDRMIERLRTLLNEKVRVFWSPDSSICREIVSVGSIGSEPGPAAFFRNGEYVALWNCEPDDLIIGRMFSE